MLLDNFFKIKDISVNGSEINAMLYIEKNHPIFKGHFPDKPVVPGVCMLQMIHEIIEKQEEKKCLLYEASNLKFLSVLDPDLTNEVEVVISIEERSETSIRINATIFAGSVIFFKMKAALKFT